MRAAPKFTKAETIANRDEALSKLRAMLSPGDVVSTLVTHRAASGMSRRLRVFVALTNDKGVPYIESVSFYIARACGFRLDYDTHEIIIPGCGFDAGFDIVYSLGRALWPEGTPEPHGTRNGEPDSDGGYALTHRTL